MIQSLSIYLRVTKSALMTSNNISNSSLTKQMQLTCCSMWTILQRLLGATKFLKSW